MFLQEKNAYMHIRLLEKTIGAQVAIIDISAIDDRWNIPLLDYIEGTISYNLDGGLRDQRWPIITRENLLQED